VAIKGSGVSSLSFLLDGKALPAIGAPPGQQVTYPLDTTTMPDGTHTLTVVATQSDLLGSTSSVMFVTHNQLDSVTNHLAAANNTIHALNSTLNTANNNIASLQSHLATANQSISTLSYLVYITVAVAAIGVILGVYAIRGGKAPWKY
jgi:hypothetical protein